MELGFINGDTEMLVNNQDELAEIIASNIIEQYRTQIVETNLGNFDIKVNYKE